jgi:AraC-like DNA-binding protein
VLRDELLETQEGLKIRQLLERSVSGLAFNGSTGERVAERIRAMERNTGFESILALLGILHELSLSEEYEVLSRFRFQSPAQPRDRERMERVYAYLMGHFTSPIRLGEVAQLAGMTGTAFCRYFRERTNRSLSRFVAELQVGYASRLLAEEQLGIAGVGSCVGIPRCRTSIGSSGRSWG